MPLAIVIDCVMWSLKCASASLPGAPLGLTGGNANDGGPRAGGLHINLVEAISAGNADGRPPSAANTPRSTWNRLESVIETVRRETVVGEQVVGEVLGETVRVGPFDFPGDESAERERQ
jgi:hypothetical protein